MAGSRCSAANCWSARAIFLTTLAPKHANGWKPRPFVQMLESPQACAADSLAPVLPVVAQAIGEGITAMAPLLPVVACVPISQLAAAPPIPSAGGISHGNSHPERSLIIVNDIED